MGVVLTSEVVDDLSAMSRENERTVAAARRRYMRMSWKPLKSWPKLVCERTCALLVEGAMLERTHLLCRGTGLPTRARPHYSPGQ